MQHRKRIRPIIPSNWSFIQHWLLHLFWRVSLPGASLKSRYVIFHSPSLNNILSLLLSGNKMKFIGFLLSEVILMMIAFLKAQKWSNLVQGLSVYTDDLVWSKTQILYVSHVISLPCGLTVTMMANHPLFLALGSSNLLMVTPWSKRLNLSSKGAQFVMALK